MVMLWYCDWVVFSMLVLVIVISYLLKSLYSWGREEEDADETAVIGYRGIRNIQLSDHRREQHAMSWSFRYKGGLLFNCQNWDYCLLPHRTGVFVQGREHNNKVSQCSHRLIKYTRKMYWQIAWSDYYLFLFVNYAFRANDFFESI